MKRKEAPGKTLNTVVYRLGREKHSEKISEETPDRGGAVVSKISLGGGEDSKLAIGFVKREQLPWKGKGRTPGPGGRSNDREVRRWGDK